MYYDVLSPHFPIKMIWHQNHTLFLVLKIKYPYSYVLKHHELEADNSAALTITDCGIIQSVWNIAVLVHEWRVLTSKGSCWYETLYW